MHAYRILLPSETDDSRFNSREKHMFTDSVQPYNKPIIDLACLVCTVKYQTSVFFILKNLSLIFHSTDLTLGQYISFKILDLSYTASLYEGILSLPCQTGCSIL